MKRLAVIDLVRGVSILLVLAGHFTYPEKGLDTSNHALIIWRTFSRNGPYGVTLFFVISGFLITRLLAEMPGGLFRPSLLRFYLRRVARIFPLFIFIVILGVLAPHVFDKTSYAYQVCFGPADIEYGYGFWVSLFTFTFNWAHLLVLHLLEGSAMHWGVLWSLAIEEQFYFLYPFLLWRMGNVANLGGFLLSMILMGPLVRWYAYLLAPGNAALALHNSFGAFDQMAIGVVLFLLWRRTRTFLEGRTFLGCLLVTVGSATLLFVYFFTSIDNGVDRIFAPSLLALGLAIFLLGALSLPLCPYSED